MPGLPMRIRGRGSKGQQLSSYNCRCIFVARVTRRATRSRNTYAQPRPGLVARALSESDRR